MAEAAAPSPTDTAALAGRPVDSLRLPSAVVTRLSELASRGYPREVCGVLIGSREGSVTHVASLTEARNLVVDRARDRYVLDPDDFHAADTAAERAGLDVVGIWHTHPDHPARPSATDLAAAWEGYTYLIVAVGAEGVVERRAWRLAEGEFREQAIEETNR